MTRTIHHLFEAYANKCPDDIAVVYKNERMTYRQLNKQANQIAHALIERGVKEEQVVAICLNREPILLACMLGILKAGAAYLPLEPSHPDERLDLILKSSEASILICTSDFKKKFTTYPGSLLILDEVKEELTHFSHENINLSVRPNQLAYVIYTSGSTGTPKGVLIEHQGVVNYGLWYGAFSHCVPQYRIDFSAKHAFDMAVTVSIVPLILGLCVVICAEEVKKDIKAYLNHLALNKIHMIKMTPSFFKVLLLEVKHHPVDLPDLKSILLGGENLSTEDCRVWLSLYPHHQLVNEYGPTETTVAVTYFPIQSEALPTLGECVPMGKFGPGIEGFLLDAEQKPVEKGQTGELHVGGICLARGYLNQPELTEKKFIHLNGKRLYKTGDICHQLPTGDYVFENRVDYQIKIRGFRVEPIEIEKCMLSLPGVAEAVILAREAKKNQKRLIAYYVLDEHSESDVLNEAQIRQHLRKYLPDYMIPCAFVRLNTFPLNANGKLDQPALPVPEYVTSQHFLMPTTALEKKLVSIWTEELDITPIGLKDDFFELGGDSLMAAKIVLKMNHVLRKNITLQEFYDHSCIEKMIPVINAKKEFSSPKEALPVYTHNSSFPLSDFQFILWMSHTFEPKVKKLNITARKRFQGPLDVPKLKGAFEALIKKHDMLLYRLSKITPTQKKKEKGSFQLIEVNLQHLKKNEYESYLNDSMQELTYFYPWPDHAPMILAKLFYLKKDTLELQICLPHVIADDISSKIIFDTLSSFYINEDAPVVHKEETPYLYYIMREQNYFHAFMHRDLEFWGNYLKDAHTFAFPKAYVIQDMKNSPHRYSTYQLISEKSLTRLKHFCAHHRVSFQDGLCATVRLSLHRVCDDAMNIKNPIMINLVKSTRNLPEYDAALGCFLRLEPIKITIHEETNLANLSEQVRHAVSYTEPYQQCGSLVKLASMHDFTHVNQLKKRFISCLTFLYTTLFPSLKLDRKYLNLCAKLSTFERKNHFVINLNVRRGFVSPELGINDSTFLGLKTLKTQTYQPDILNVDNFFDVCFLRDEGTNKPYVVISANLLPEFRQEIAQELVSILENET